MARNKLEPGCTFTTLTADQVRMILRIYWTDRFQRPGKSRSTPGLRDRLARLFRVSPEVIKKIVARRRGNRFRSVDVHGIKKNIRSRIERQGRSL